QHEELAFRHFERNVVDDGRALIPFGDLVERDRHRGRTLASARYERQSLGGNKSVISGRARPRAITSYPANPLWCWFPAAHGNNLPFCPQHINNPTAMTLPPYETLGTFYLGRPIDPATGADRTEALLYDARDLTTHAVCVGMTGSGKTGLCLSLLEEAAIDGIPAIAIDPKGDLGNLLLAFPDLDAKSFAPWIDRG